MDGGHQFLPPFRRQSRFVFDGESLFDPLPVDQITALFEWGLNWCVTQTAHRYLILHAGVAALGDDAILLPGTSGSGKSTLTTALCFSGWRLLSDELALIDRHDGLVYPMPRPLSLKNASIDLIRSLFPQARIGASIWTERKGTVALVCPPIDSVLASNRPARIRRIVFPTFDSGSVNTTTEVSRGRAFSRLFESAFNYGVAQGQDFDCLADLVEAAPALDLRFNDLTSAKSLIDDMFQRLTCAA
jgi:HprK-related kinase A